MNAGLLNIFMNLNQLFTNLYELKFKGRKIMEEIINVIYEKQLIEQNIDKAYNKMVYHHAIKNAGVHAGQLMAKFEDEWLVTYTGQIDKIHLNMKQLLTHKILSGQQWSPYELLVVELVQLAKDISLAYFEQHRLVTQQWQEQSSILLSSDSKNNDLKELLLHIGFETHLDSRVQDSWKAKLSALSNQRYNPKKM